MPRRRGLCDWGEEAGRRDDPDSSGVEVAQSIRTIEYSPFHQPEFTFQKRLEGDSLQRLIWNRESKFLPMVLVEGIPVLVDGEYCFASTILKRNCGGVKQ